MTKLTALILLAVLTVLCVVLAIPRTDDSELTCEEWLAYQAARGYPTNTCEVSP